MIFIFFEDYNITAVKLILFIIIFGLNVAINGLFYKDSTMHRIYKREFTILYEIPGLIYSSIISITLSSLIKNVGLTQRLILNFKRKIFIDKNEAIKEKNNIMRKIKIRFVIFMFCAFIFLISFWYYVGCFCAVYDNTQLLLIKDTLISFGLSLLYPFGINLLPGIFRLAALKNEKERNIKLFKFSKILAYF